MKFSSIAIGLFACLLLAKSAEAGTTVKVTMKSGFYEFDGMGRLNCFPHAFSRCYDITVSAPHKYFVINGGTTKDGGETYEVGVKDNFQLFYTGGGNEVLLTIYDGTNDGAGSKRYIKQFTQLGSQTGFSGDPAVFTFN